MTVINVDARKKKKQISKFLNEFVSFWSLRSFILSVYRKHSTGKTMSGRVAVLLFFAATFYTEFPCGSAYNWKAFPDPETKIIYPDKKSATMTWKWSLQRNTNKNKDEIINQVVINRYEFGKQLATEKTIGEYLYGGPGNEKIQTDDDSLFSLRFEKGVVGGKDGFAEFTIKDVARQGKNKDGSAVNVETGNYTYICKMTVIYVVNNPGPKSTTLIVYEKPSFTNTPKSKQTSNNSVTLECTAKGRPQPRISWTILEASGEIRVIVSQTRLTLNPKSDSGVYNCTARSVAGSVSAVAVVQYTECDSTCSTDSMGIEMTGLTFKSDYENINSKESEKLRNIIEQECLRAYATYSPNKPIYSCRVLNFRNGSVVANVQITYPSTVVNPREPLEKAIQTGTFAGQAVKKSFVSPTKVPPPTTSPPTTITTTDETTTGGSTSTAKTDSTTTVQTTTNETTTGEPTVLNDGTIAGISVAAILVAVVIVVLAV